MLNGNYHYVQFTLLINTIDSFQTLTNNTKCDHQFRYKQNKLFVKYEISDILHRNLEGAQLPKSLGSKYL